MGFEALRLRMVYSVLFLKEHHLMMAEMKLGQKEKFVLREPKRVLQYKKKKKKNLPPNSIDNRSNAGNRIKSNAAITILF